MQDLPSVSRIEPSRHRHVALLGSFTQISAQPALLQRSTNKGENSQIIINENFNIF
jgi:hypothetical protein